MIPKWLLILLLFIPGGCRSAPPDPFPVTGPLDDASILRVLAERTADVTTAYAELVLVYEGPEQDGSFDAVFHWERPRCLRLVAFKDVVLATRPIFDLLLADEAYHLEVVTEEGEQAQRHQGSVDRFPARHPRFGELFWTGEALFLPGRLAEDGRPGVERDEAEIRVNTRLLSGAEVVWRLEPATLAVRRAVVRTPDGRDTYELEYGLWVALDHRFFPQEVILRRSDGSARITGRVDLLEINQPSDPTVFQFQP